MNFYMHTAVNVEQQEGPSIRYTMIGFQSLNDDPFLFKMLNFPQNAL
jgi:hypothetical protein